MTDSEFIELRKKVIEKEFSNMNDMQFEAVSTVNGPLLILAGAGSGKTTVLVNRIAYLVKYGNAYRSNTVGYISDDTVKNAEDFLNGKTDKILDDGLSVDAVNPWQILAITFTNKAAGELKDRIGLRLGDAANDIWAGTFHSVCGKILRRFADRLGYTSHFTVYDTDDQRRLMKEIMKANDFDEKFLSHKAVLSEISSAKDKLITPEEYALQNSGDYRKKMISSLYIDYQKKLANADAMDFDDMIVNTVKLLKENPDILEYYGNKFKYVMVDEYQDTNFAQYVLISLFSKLSGNICVVGDDDQSIYRFRGATIENILNFEEEYNGSRVIRLEQNYRSTGNILDAANAVIKNNRARKGKNLWTDKGNGEKITVFTADSAQGEARYVADKILDEVGSGARFSDFAVLYRMNAQSAALENTFARAGIPYKVIGGLRFFDRREIKDVLAYLSVINNKNDDLRLQRIINFPKRGIGDTTVKNAMEIASALSLSLFEVFKTSDEYAGISRAAAKLKEFCKMIEELENSAYELSVHELLEELLEKTGFISALESEGDEAEDRIENVKELSSNVLQYELENDEPSLSGFLENVALVSDIDGLDSETESRRTVMMTVHSAKGLEFENVFLIGLEEGIFPGNQSLYAGESEIEEERRLAYVAITRAKRKLYVTNAYMRMLYGTTSRNLPSRFIKEIPEELCEFSGVASDSGIHKTEIFHSDYKPVHTIPTSSFSRTVKPKTDYFVGQSVKHKTFGVGKVLKVSDMGSDTLLEIAFENAGTKKLMANYANLTII